MKSMGLNILNKKASENKLSLGLSYFLIVVLATISSTVSAKNNAEKITLSWNQVQSVRISENTSKHFLHFNGAIYDEHFGELPLFFKRTPLTSGENACTAELDQATYIPLTEDEISKIAKNEIIGNEIKIKAEVGYERTKPFAYITFAPIRKNASTGKYEKLSTFELTVKGQQLPQILAANYRTIASSSVLTTGSWHKIGVTNDGIYKLSYTFLKNMGVDVKNLNPKNIRLYGNGGGMLPSLNSKFRHDDLQENSIFIAGESDNTFDENDYILFYGQSPHRWTFSPSPSGCNLKFEHVQHLYTDTNYYFITTDLGAGKRIVEQNSSLATPTYTTTTYDDYGHHEKDVLNLIKSGNQMYGEYFEDLQSTHTFPFNFPNIDLSAQGSIKVTLAGKYTQTHSFTVSTGSSSYNITNNPVSSDPKCYFCEYAIPAEGCSAFTPTSSNVLVSIKRNAPGAVGWLNYIDVNVRRNLTMNSDQMLFRDSKSVSPGSISSFNISSSAAIQIWDVTNPIDVKQQEVNYTGTSFSFNLGTDTLHEFAAYNGNSFYTPAYIGKIENQNLHALTAKDLLIVTHPAFINEANTIANFHTTKDGLRTTVVTTSQVYNEFSSGAQDATAIRDFMIMFYYRAQLAKKTEDLPRYLLLIGDGSFDNKNYVHNNTCFIPTYQSDNSTAYTDSYVSDDYFGYLDSLEGNSLSSDKVDIGIGRFPVRTPAEAQGIINKIIRYTTVGETSASQTACSNQSNSSLGDWRNNICFVGDDEDGSLHQSQSNQLATFIDSNYRHLNTDKIFFDAYKQEATPGGDRYPEATQAINKRIEKGVLIMNYTGHGGELGWAHERVLEISDINSWTNMNKLAFFMTATCEFSRYDDPDRTSAGEYVLLNPNGGGVSLLTTVRLVYANANYTLNTAFYNEAFKPIGNEMPRLGDLCRLTKVNSGGSNNTRSFALLGDPALRLAYPKYSIATTKINNTVITSSQKDTLKALSPVTVTGYVKDLNGDTLKSFNGTIYPTVFDKAQTINTLSNDGPSNTPAFAFKSQKSILYKGKVIVQNGKFSFTFIVPKDISYQFGRGKISYYAENGSEDATGYSQNVIIGGSSTNAAADPNGPEVKLFMNNEKFAFGGSTNENPQLYAVVNDSTGINTTGNGIGHDIVGVLDDKTENSIVLNDYYQANMNSYKSGTIRYPFNNLSEGKHSLRLKVWDIYNNSSQSYTEFVVAKQAELALAHVLNYPNPFTTKTQFFFEHNHCCEKINVQVQIFTVSGKIVKTINTFVDSDGFRSQPIDWDGTDDYGDKIGKGVYIYRLKINTGTGKAADKFEKLVILN